MENRRSTATEKPSPGAAPVGAAWRGIAGFWEKAGAWAVPPDRTGGGYRKVARHHAPQIGFCLLFVFASSWGQTFLLSLFQPAWMHALGIGPGAMGAIYGGATLASGLLLTASGRWLDRAHPGRIGAVTLAGLAAFSLLAAAVVDVWMLALALLGLRFFGQGLSSNVGMTNAARWFSHNRGKAISLASLGFPLGEMILPGTIAISLALIGWRWTWVTLAVVCAAVLLPMSRALIARHRGVALDLESAEGRGAADTEGRGTVLRDWRFYTMLAMMWPLPFAGTGIIFFQGMIAESRGWSAAVFPTGFIVFALVRACCTLSAGAWVDRLGAVRMLSVPPIAFAAGLACLLRPEPAWAYGFFACLGVSFGSAGAVTTAAWSEMFGVARIGTIRALSSAFAVFITAAAPVAFGLVFERGASPETVILGSAAILLLVSWPLSIVLRRAHRGARHRPD